MSTALPPAPIFAVARPYLTQPPLGPDQALLLGRVIDASSQRPLAGAELRLDTAGGPERLNTDAAGRYQAVIGTARPFGFTVVARMHAGGVGFGTLCPQERRELNIPLLPGGGGPGSPIVIQSGCG